jgi:biofilm PGA synthesis N-glycosyltransferase PgaC
MKYAVVTPARDEAGGLMQLAVSLAAQTVPPVEWVIVENGSVDETLAIASRLQAEHDWIRVLVTPAGPPQTRGTNVVHALQAGFESLRSVPDVAAVVDADVTFGTGHFERILAAFAADPRLGMTGGNCCELEEGVWREQLVTGSHVWGADRSYRWECLQDVLPYEENMGWDGIDQIRAAVRGWRVGRVEGLQFRHHRREGTRDGSRIRVWAAQGTAAHYMGYRFSYLLARTLHRVRREPAAFAMLSAYVASALRREERCPDREVRRLVRRQQRARHLLQHARAVARR